MVYFEIKWCGWKGNGVVRNEMVWSEVNDVVRN